jgi:N-acetylmuramoyl-L-alanine amidase
MLPIDKYQIPFNTSKRTSPIEWIVIHDTGNTKVGANALANYNYFNTGSRQSSADIFIDDRNIVQINDYNVRYTWAVGDGKGKYGITNNNSISIEICINSDGDYEKAVSNTVDLVKYLMVELNIPIERVVRHYDASRKNCPASMNNGSWEQWYIFKDKLIRGDIMTVEQALDKIIAKGINIDKNRWLIACDYVTYLGDLFIKIAEKI